MHEQIVFVLYRDNGDITYRLIARTDDAGNQVFEEQQPKHKAIFDRQQMVELAKAILEWDRQNPQILS